MSDVIGFVPDIYTVLNRMPTEGSLPAGLYVYMDIPFGVNVDAQVQALFGYTGGKLHRDATWTNLRAPTAADRDKLTEMGVNHVFPIGGGSSMTNHLIRGTQFRLIDVRALAYFCGFFRRNVLAYHQRTGLTQTHRLDGYGIEAICSVLETPRQVILNNRIARELQFQIVNDEVGTAWYVEVHYYSGPLEAIRLRLSSKGILFTDYENGAHLDDVQSWLYVTPPIA